MSGGIAAGLQGSKIRFCWPCVICANLCALSGARSDSPKEYVYGGDGRPPLW